MDYNRISGSGPNGRIVRADVEAYAAAGEQTSARPFIEYNATNASFIDDAADLESPKTIIPYKGIRRKTGETMQRAWATIPMVTHHVTAPAKALMEYRAILNKGLESKAEQITIGELLLKLTAVALTMVPPINSSLSDEGIVLYNNVNLGIATATSDGLLVPVLRNAQNKGLLTMSREAKDLAARARNGALSPDDIVGATFTVSNLGGFDSVDFFTPIINPPQAAILGIGRVTDSVAAINGEATVIPTVGLSLTYDHRIIDGATAAIFIKTLMMLMDNPARAVLN
ncbi:MAG: 2-oxo acid dehydrogenase subunit E2 [Oscillospiraceae bacterium]|nr:2-oxo acid dehydrogenase subunit E2 [Oscillospiraceae bacterium]